MTSQTHDLPQTVILTGGTSGLGYVAARMIAVSQPNWHVILASRNRQQGTQAANILKRQTSNPHIEWLPLNLASLASVRAFAGEVTLRELPPLHAVVCNAGVQIVSGTAYTQDGFEMTFGVNCLGHFLLVNLLLRQLVAPARIVFVSSDAHDPAYRSSMNRFVHMPPPRYRNARALAWPEQYPDEQASRETPQSVGMRRYSTSKLCNVFYAYELARRLQAQGLSTPEQPITVNAYNPGPTPGTGLVRDTSAFQRFGWKVLLPLMRPLFPDLSTPEASGKALARLVLDPALEQTTGKYIERMHERASSQESYDEHKAAELWESSAELVKLRPDETILIVHGEEGASTDKTTFR
ncbi:MAG: SDR family NAD(P)-dependent oxidoreductase [Ktedonobacteraceae bacterium]|nr:SDR family NAD(P)-dependent oxidoreductase [Ktedonobacteraceae bacterium]